MILTYFTKLKSVSGDRPQLPIAHSFFRLKMSQTRQQPLTLRLRKNYLPDDIVLDILSRLPVKSILRFRCVSKSLCSHIDSSKFISTHLNKLVCSIDNDHHEGYVIHMPNLINTQLCTVSCDRTFDRISELRIPFTFQCGIAYFLGSCNGILCLTDCINYRKSLVDDIYLWNPSIRIFKRLSGTCLSQLNSFRLGFAYDSPYNDYKVVRISRPRTQRAPPPEVEVYTLSSDSWRKVEFGMSWRPNILFYTVNCSFPYPFVSGHLHFMLHIIVDMIDGGGRKASAMILSFNVNSEKFGELPFPDDDDEGSFKGGHYASSRCLTSCKGKVALTKFEHSLQSNCMVCSVWVMRDYGVRESWNKLFSVPLESSTRFIGFTTYGSLLFRKIPELVFNTRKLELANKFVLLDPKTLHQTNLSNQLIYPLNVIPLFVATYRESLALLDAADVVSY